MERVHIRGIGFADRRIRRRFALVHRLRLDAVHRHNPKAARSCRYVQTALAYRQRTYGGGRPVSAFLGDAETVQDLGFAGIFHIYDKHPVVGVAAEYEVAGNSGRPVIVTARLESRKIDSGNVLWSGWIGNVENVQTVSTTMGILIGYAAGSAKRSRNVMSC